MTWTKQLTMTVFPIGQGLFTQCDVKVGGKIFRIVYDCGAKPSRIEQAQPYLDLLKGRRLDLLVISHFHSDHISYIPELLLNGMFQIGHNYYNFYVQKSWK